MSFPSNGDCPGATRAGILCDIIGERAVAQTTPGVFWTTIQDGALLTAVQVQPAVIVTVTTWEPPAAAKLLLVGDIEQLQSVVALAGGSE